MIVPGSVNPLLLGDEGYQISRSVRFRSSASAYLERTPAGAGNRQKFTFSYWAKRGTLSVSQEMYFMNAGGGTFSQFSFTAGNVINFSSVTSSIADINLTTTAVYRDPAAWYHIVLSVDTTQATSTNRVLLYVNGVVQAISGTYPAQNYNCQLNTTTAQNIGRPTTGTFDGYLTEYNFIDGQQLTPNSFGTFNSYGVWQPITYGGSYGTNGFYLPFTNTTSTTTLGYDFSPQGNNWTTNNISLTAGVTYDSMTDVPTLTSATAANYCVLNSLTKNGTAGTFSSANLNITVGSDSSNVGTIGFSSGKFYFEITVTASTENSPAVGIVDPRFTQAVFANAGTYIGYGYIGTANKGSNGSYSSYGATYTVNDIIGVAVDMDAGTLVFYKNGTSQGTAYTGISGTYVPAVGNNNSGSTKGYAANFGQRPFSYTPPTGFVALNTQNLPAPTISNGASYMAATTYTGTGAAQSISNAVNGVSFQPDWVWVKGRSGATDHAWYDAVRGVQKQLESNNTAAETTETTGLTAFGSTGFTVGALAQMNTSSATYVAWQWNAGGSTVTNTSGSISAQVRANPTAGFSVVTYTGTGANATVGHGLGVAPKMVIVKGRNFAGSGWIVWQSLLLGTEYLSIESTNAKNALATVWNSTIPNSSVFSLGTNTQVNQNTSTYVAYLFAEVTGFSKFGSYIGNGSADGPFVYLGFRPRFVMWKRTDSTSDWEIVDAVRPDRNVVTGVLYANLSNAEATSSGECDFTSNGFKIRDNSNRLNASGGTYIYMAFAENPFKLSLAR